MAARVPGAQMRVESAGEMLVIRVPMRYRIARMILTLYTLLHDDE